MSNDFKDTSWEHLLYTGLDLMLREIVAKNGTDIDHVRATPLRFVKSMKELFAGVNQQPEDALNTLFKAKAHDMIHVKDITYFSTCAHHLLPFFGTMSFAYIPKTYIVGLSKIPRLIKVYSRRPQVQEELSNQIVDAFQGIVDPAGCALMVRGYHMCCMSRGIEQPTSYTETTALRGVFTDSSVKSEWLASCNAPQWKA